MIVQGAGKGYEAQFVEVVVIVPWIHYHLVGYGCPEVLDDRHGQFRALIGPGQK